LTIETIAFIVGVDFLDTSLLEGYNNSEDYNNIEDYNFPSIRETCTGESSPLAGSWTATGLPRSSNLLSFNRRCEQQFPTWNASESRSVMNVDRKPYWYFELSYNSSSQSVETVDPLWRLASFPPSWLKEIRYFAAAIGFYYLNGKIGCAFSSGLFDAGSFQSFCYFIILVITFYI